MEYYDIPIPPRPTETEYPVPGNLSIDFPFDHTRGVLRLSVTVGNEEVSYLGRGKVCIDDGFCRVPALAIIDPFLMTRDHIPGKHLKIFLKAIYPKLVREQLPVRLSLVLHESPVVTVTVSDIVDGAVHYHLRWVDGGQTAVALSGLDGYVAAGDHIYKGTPRLLNMLPHTADGAHIATGNDAKTLGKLCDLAGYMFCGDRLQDLRFLGRGLPSRPAVPAAPVSPERPATPASPARFSDFTISPDPTPAFVPIPPVTKTYDGPSLLSVRMRASNREMNTISARFAADAVTFGAVTGEKCDYTPLNCYWPTYEAMGQPQKDYFLYFRTAFMAGETLKTDLSYIFIAVYELINHAFPPSKETFRHLLRYWTAYREKYSRLDLYLPIWAVDYILTNDLDVSLSEVALAVPEASEVYSDFIDAVLNDALKTGLHSLPPALWKHYAGYDVTLSKLWQSEHRDGFEAALRRMLEALDHLTREVSGKPLLLLDPPPAAKKEYTSFTGAICARQYRRTIRLEYVPLSKSGKLHKLLEGAFKYTENALRAKCKVMGRLRVPTLPKSVTDCIDAVLQNAAPSEAARKPEKLKIDLSAALALEKSSWDNTKALLDAVEDTAPIEPTEVVPTPVVSEPVPDEQTVSDNFFDRLTSLQREVLCAILDGADASTLDALCSAEFTLTDTVLDEINELSTDFFGDILFENGELIQDYTEYLSSQRGTL